MNSSAFGKQLKSIREKRGVTTEELAKVLDVNARSIWQIETGRRLTTLPNLVKICNFLKIDPNALLTADLNKELEKLDSEYKKFFDLILEFNQREFYQCYDIAELIIRNRERYK
jgi:transcriptional regulator with XRE-family HTH domain